MGFGCNGLGWGRAMGWGGGWLGMLVGLVVLGATVALIVAAVVWALRRARGGTTSTDTAGLPLEIARRRLASGEISVEEYEQIRQALRGEGAV